MFNNETIRSSSGVSENYDLDYRSDQFRSGAISMIAIFMVAALAVTNYFALRHENAEIREQLEVTQEILENSTKADAMMAQIIGEQEVEIKLMSEQLESQQREIDSLKLATEKNDF